MKSKHDAEWRRHFFQLRKMSLSVKTVRRMIRNGYSVTVHGKEKALPLVQETFEERKVLVEGIAQKIKALVDCGAIEPASKLD